MGVRETGIAWAIRFQGLRLRAASVRPRLRLTKTPPVGALEALQDREFAAQLLAT